jgi:FtsZ-binding cell division protein ZapB
MSRKKGLSKDEKRTKLLELFHETKDVFTKDELEAQGAKKGVVRQSVMDVVKELVDDNEVNSDKIGTSVYFWSFPSETANKKQNQINSLTTEIEILKSRLSVLQKETEEASRGREESAERTKQLEQLAKLKEENAKLKAELQVYAENDPELIEAFKHDAKVAIEAANRWTENIFSLKSYICNKYGISTADFDKNFRIPEDFDYIEVPKSLQK